MRRAQVTGWLVLAALLAASCSKCGAEKVATPAAATGILRRLPKAAAGVLIAPDALALGEALKVVQGLKAANFAAALQGFTSAQEYADALIRQVGFDVRSPEALDKAGIDPKKGVAVVLAKGGDAWLVLGAKQDTRIGATLRTLATDRLGAGVYEKKDVEGVELHTLSRAQGMTPRLGYVVVDGFVLVASEGQVPNLVQWAKLAEADSLAKDPAYADALSRLPEQRQVIGWMPKGSPALVGAPVTQVAASGVLDPTGLRVTVDVPAGELFSAATFTRAAGPDLLSVLPADSFLVGRFAGDPKTLAAPARRMLGASMLKAFEEAGFNLDAEVFSAMKPGAVFSLALSPRAQFSQGMPDLDARRTNPFSFVQLAGVVEAADAARVPDTLRKLAAVAPKFGAQVRPVDRKDGQPLYETRYEAGEGVHFGAKGAKVVFGNPLGRVEAALDADGKGPPPVENPDLLKTLNSRAASVVVDLRKLAGQVQALPSEAWGVGGFAIKASTLRWLDATDDLLAFSVGLDAQGQFVQGQLVLSLKPKGETPKGNTP